MFGAQSAGEFETLTLSPTPRSAVARVRPSYAAWLAPPSLSGAPEVTSHPADASTSFGAPPPRVSTNAPAARAITTAPAAARRRHDHRVGRTGAPSPTPTISSRAAVASSPHVA